MGLSNSPETGPAKQPDATPDILKSEDAHQAGSSLFSLANKFKLGIAALVVTTGLVGCSPQTRSYYLGTFTDLPPPPPTARMQLETSTEEDGTVFINYVMWDAKQEKFFRKDIHYTSQKLMRQANFGSYSEAGGYQQNIHDGEVLAGGAIVDQTNGRILLDGDRYIDGRTGNTYDGSGKIIKEFKHADE